MIWGVPQWGNARMFQGRHPSPSGSFKVTCPSDAPTKRPEKVASVLARVPGNPQYRWFMINVGKTIINHPQNHHGWYTHVYTIKMGMVYDIVLPTLYVEKYLLGLDTWWDSLPAAAGTVHEAPINLFTKGSFLFMLLVSNTICAG